MADRAYSPCTLSRFTAGSEFPPEIANAARARGCTSTMKYALLAIGVAGILPIALVLQSNIFVRKNFWIFFGLFPFLLPALPQLDIEIISWDREWMTGHVRGLVVSAIDFIAVGAYIAIRHQKNSIRYHLPFILYACAIGLSVTQADVPSTAALYLWQFIRIYFAAIVIARACVDEGVPEQFMKGMAIGLGIQLVLVVYQKFVLGAVQPSGTFAHQNTLALVIHMVVFPHLALLLSGDRRLPNIAVPLAGFLVASLTASRAGIGFCVIGFVACYLLSLTYKWTRWKAFMGVAGLATATALTPIAFSALENRFQISRLSEDAYNERAAFNRTAIVILGDHPLGVGANHYSYFGKNYGYSVRAGVIPFEGNLDNIVHNAYLLNAAESGYPGLITFILLLFHPLWVAFRYSLKNVADHRSALLLGLGVSLMTVYAHSMFEYILVVQECQYAFAVIAGMTFGLAHQMRQAYPSGRGRNFRSSAHLQPGRASAGRLLR